jgi:hypothetical protein
MDDQTMHVISEDANPCCKRKFERMVDKGKIGALVDWECPSCGCWYQPRENGTIMVWEYHGLAEVF